MKIEILSSREREQEKDGMFSKKDVDFYLTSILIEITDKERQTIEQHPLLKSVIFLSFKSSLGPKHINSGIQPSENNISFNSLLSNNKFKIKSYSLSHLSSLRSDIYEAVESFNGIINTTNNLEMKDVIDTDYFEDGALYNENN